METKRSHDAIIRMAQKAKIACAQMALLSSSVKNEALRRMAEALLKGKAYLIRENTKDLNAARRQNYSKPIIDRLTLNEKRIGEMAQCLWDTVKLKDPVGEVLAVFRRPNGLLIKKIRTPIGVIGIIYESRPNVTSDCIGLCLKAGNAVILKGGKEAFHSNKAVFSVLKKALHKTKIPQEAIHLVSWRDRASLNVLLAQERYVDLIIPRGGEGLIRFVAEHSRIPVIKHYKGVCHTYVGPRADLKMARALCFNAKVQRPGVCNAMETMLVHRDVAARFLPLMITDFQKAGVEIRGCPRTRQIIGKGIKRATAKDWEEEYLDLILSVKVVDSLEEAIDHINTYGSHHSDAIVTQDAKEADLFLRSVDSACLYVNASTRFTDGYQFGFGAEIGISTDKLHARGPMALEELTTYKYLVYGKGQIRT
ncbi:MAG: glutamate-5-semialdehyde dehydrogenase [Omnitrophica WOR_2 bacterium RIFCSPLOWO2_12_FULL_50_9]|nr:MAG: glutamate-5-semialdehyde dehydrogenase [Omnitrophica WOR_2 bacterium RIFCSPHIGHO2_02_FULL_50_17]OGX43460.1 MAG: glutamate-5-semialdehyde dehydrogenase [Omnitrophica WOR_2 bacterium RIFCSPLOWO2_12_FULL_50_9]